MGANGADNGNAATCLDLYARGAPSRRRSVYRRQKSRVRCRVGSCAREVRAGCAHFVRLGAALATTTNEGTKLLPEGAVRVPKASTGWVRKASISFYSSARQKQIGFPRHLTYGCLKDPPWGGPPIVVALPTRQRFRRSTTRKSSSNSR